MKPIEFKDQNTEIAKNQDQYGTLPALHLNDENGQVITKWKLTWRERIKVLFTGVIWMNLFSFNKPLSPSLLSTKRKDMYHHPNDDLGFWDKIKFGGLIDRPEPED